MFTEAQNAEIELRDKLATQVKTPYMSKSGLRHLLSTIDELREANKPPAEGHWNKPTGAPLPAIGVWLNIKDTRTKLFGEGSFKAKRLSYVEGGQSRGLWNVEREDGVVEVVKVKEWQHV